MAEKRVEAGGTRQTHGQADNLKLDILERQRPLEAGKPAKVLHDLVQSITSHAINTASLLSDFGLPTTYPYEKFRFQLGYRLDEGDYLDNNDGDRQVLLEKYLGEEVKSWRRVPDKPRRWRVEGLDNAFIVDVSDDNSVKVSKWVSVGRLMVRNAKLVAEEHKGALNVYQQFRHDIELQPEFSLMSLYDRVNVGEIPGANVFTCCLGMKPSPDDRITTQQKSWLFRSYPEEGLTQGTVPRDVCMGHQEYENPASISAKYHLVMPEQERPFLLVYPIQYSPGFQSRDRDMVMGAVGMELARSLGVRDIATPAMEILEKPGQVAFEPGADLKYRSPHALAHKWIQRYRMIHDWMGNSDQFNVFKWDGELPAMKPD